jgi:FHA domain
MNAQSPAPTRSAAAQAARWVLEIVRGQEPGRIYPLASGETILGNSAGGTGVLDLAGQEPGARKQLAQRHAILASVGQDFTIRDLESPAGTFVNRQRLLTGQTRRLESGDIIQLGSLQLLVKSDASPGAPALTPLRESSAATSGGTPESSRGGVPAGSAAALPTAAPVQGAATHERAPLPAATAPVVSSTIASRAAPPRLPIAFTMSGGAQCRKWDDFLVVAAQRWSSLRDELMSGRLSEYLRKIERPELVPSITPHRSPDDQLDEWLARVPASAKSAPEIDVHPQRLVIRTKTGGSILGQPLRVSNVGYRLLRWTARVEPPEAGWIRLGSEHSKATVQTIDQTDLPIHLELPETIDRPLRASIVIESNGGNRRIDVLIERPSSEVVVPPHNTNGFAADPAWRTRLLATVASLRPVARLAAGCLVAVALRLLVAVMNVLPLGGRGTSLLELRLSSVALLLVGAGALTGLALVRGRSEPRDLPAAAFAGGALGLVIAAVWFAVVQSVEKTLGSWSSSLGALTLFWGALGALVALLSVPLLPHRNHAPETPR